MEIRIKQFVNDHRIPQLIHCTQYADIIEITVAGRKVLEIYSVYQPEPIEANSCEEHYLKSLSISVLDDSLVPR